MGMGKPGGSTQQIRNDADTVAAHLVASLSDRRRAENIAAAAVVHEVHALLEMRMASESEVQESGGDADVTLAQRAVQCEAAVALSLSRTVVREMMTVGAQLTWRLPAIDSAFAAGDLDYPRVRAIALVVAKASDETVAALEADVLAAALRCGVRGLRERIWTSWIRFAPDEAAAARKATESEERCANITRGDDGMANLMAKISVLEGAECDAILEELAATVCPRDPRTKKQLRGFALIALAHREDVLTCQCGNDFCPGREAPGQLRPRRPHLLQITIDIETLLGLTGEPARLSDGTVLDPDTARLLAEDARWQGLLTEMLDASRLHGHPETGTGTGTANDTDCSAGTDTADSHSPAGDPTQRPLAPTGLAAPTGPAVPTGTGRQRPPPRAQRLLARGRIRPAAPLPTPPARTSATQSRPWPKAGSEVATSDAIAAFLTAVALDSTLADGRYPDGHGGDHTPPPGALTYRPTAELAALTRATHNSCTFPGCSVPAARCEIDHVVPYNHERPELGGWTITSNLQPLCHYHHQAKTLKLWAAATLAGDAIIWTPNTGLIRITPSTYGTVMVPEKFIHNRPPRRQSQPDDNPDTDSFYLRDDSPDGEKPPPDETSDEPSDELYEPTWWETNIGDHNTPWSALLSPERLDGVPTLSDIAQLRDPQAREDAIHLRERFLEHRAIISARFHHQPPPF